jgi:hypothetical protein
MLAHDVPGILLFPEQGGEVETSYRVDDRQDLLVREVATRRNPIESPFSVAFINDLQTILSEVIELPVCSSN